MKASRTAAAPTAASCQAQFCDRTSGGVDRSRHAACRTWPGSQGSEPDAARRPPGIQVQTVGAGARSDPTRHRPSSFGVAGGKCAQHYEPDVHPRESVPMWRVWRVCMRVRVRVRMGICVWNGDDCENARSLQTRCADVRASSKRVARGCRKLRRNDGTGRIRSRSSTPPCHGRPRRLTHRRSSGNRQRR